jgi:hypothetical protein
MANGCLVCPDDHVYNVFPCFEDMTSLLQALYILPPPTILSQFKLVLTYPELIFYLSTCFPEQNHYLQLSHCTWP